LANNPGANDAKAVAGAHNLYLWRTDAAHPDGQTTFIATLEANDIKGGNGVVPQTTPDGRYLVFSSASQLVSTDTDGARDAYRYDSGTGKLTRLSTNVFGVAGNGEGLDVTLRKNAVSDDGSAVVFSTSEALSPADGNDEPDAYLWKSGHVSLITTGSVGGGVTSGNTGLGIDASGQNILFQTAQQLTPSDRDGAVDVYDARIDGGFSIPEERSCSGEDCRSPIVTPIPLKPKESQTPKPGNLVQSKPCPRGKVKRHGKCVKRHHPKKHKRAGFNNGGGK
jgi:hypothetical protein